MPSSLHPLAACKVWSFMFLRRLLTIKFWLTGSRDCWQCIPPRSTSWLYGLLTHSIHGPRPASNFDHQHSIVTFWPSKTDVRCQNDGQSHFDHQNLISQCQPPRSDWQVLENDGHASQIVMVRVWCSNFDGQNLMSKLWWSKFDDQTWMVNIWSSKFDGQNLIIKFWWSNLIINTWRSQFDDQMSIVKSWWSNQS